ncbi:MAG: tail fiber domain-containing protein [Flavobacteriaceae bacterium]|nr:tail fiber domain-containing protein [Flavobacteriaceae bacterium]
MKTILKLSALLITLTLTAQSNTATWWLNDTSGNGIQSQSSTASGNASTAMGSSTEASGDYSITMGGGTTASRYASTAMGEFTTASGGSSTAMGGFTTASGEYSTSIGFRTTASDYNSLAVGQYNLLSSTVTNSATEFSLENTAFVIGNGINADNKSDALTVLFDGTTTIAGDLNVNSDKKVFFGNQSFIEGAVSGTVLILNSNNNILFRPGGTTTVNFEPNGDAIFNGDVKVTSDKRLKANIISLGSTLAKLLQIDGKTYTMKKDENKKQKIGVLAQDIEKVFPELVSESNGVKSVNYQGLVPVLINALKEQDTKLNKQQTEIDELKAIVTKLITP